MKHYYLFGSRDLIKDCLNSDDFIEYIRDNEHLYNESSWQLYIYDSGNPNGLLEVAMQWDDYIVLDEIEFDKLNEI